MVIHDFMQKIGDMRFFYIDELYEKKELVKEKYEMLKADEKYIYKWFYFFQTCHLNNRLKENMWDYITGVTTAEKIEKEYELYCQKKEEASRKSKERQALSNI